MASNIHDHLLGNFRSWAQRQFHEYHSCVAYIETKDSLGNINVGNCFHIGDGIFVTARHVIQNKLITNIGFDSNAVIYEPKDNSDKNIEIPVKVNIVEGPFYHFDEDVDIGCFRLDFIPKLFIPLSLHMDEFLGQSEFLLHRALLLGYPLIPFNSKPILAATLGDISAVVNIFNNKYLHYIVSTTMKSGFSGGPVFVAYNELNKHSETLLLGLVTNTLSLNNEANANGLIAVLPIELIYHCLKQSNLLPIKQNQDKYLQ